MEAPAEMIPLSEAIIPGSTRAPDQDRRRSDGTNRGRAPKIIA
jgi:hypothetical protein